MDEMQLHTGRHYPTFPGVLSLVVNAADTGFDFLVLPALVRTVKV